MDQGEESILRINKLSTLKPSLVCTMTSICLAEIIQLFLIKLSLLFSGRFICAIDLFCFGEGSIVIFGFVESVEDEEGRA